MHNFFLRNFIREKSGKRNSKYNDFDLFENNKTESKKHSKQSKKPGLQRKQIFSKDKQSNSVSGKVVA